MSCLEFLMFSLTAAITSSISLLYITCASPPVKKYANRNKIRNSFHKFIFSLIILASLLEKKNNLSSTST
uniref:Putative secreted protein n=1 Tax=Panstrongylus lignarius TaxID=156445 RepID=A0A224XUL0_9HEMI